jgi:cell division protein FtsL
VCPEQIPRIDMTMTSDNFWKILNLAVGVILMPLAGWVWSINVEVAQLRNDVGDLEEQVDKLEVRVKELDDASRTLIGVEKDVQHIREILKRIEVLVAS